MSDADLGAIKIGLELDDNGFDKSIASSTKAMDSAKAAAKTMAAGIGVATAAMGAGVAAAIALTKEIAGIGDSAAKTAAKVGTTAEVIQELDHAAGLSGTNIDVVKDGLKDLGKNAEAAAAGGGAAKDAFKRLGIEVLDANGALKSNEQLFMESAEAISRMSNETEKGAVALKIFGGAGTNLIPMLNQGAEGIAAMRQEARDLGLVMSNEAAAASEALNDNIARLEGQLQGLKTSIGAALLPVFLEVTEVMRDMTGDMQDQATVTDIVRQGVHGFADALKAVSPLLTVVGGTVGGLIDFFNTLNIAAKTLAIGVGGIVEGFLEMQYAMDSSAKNAERLARHKKRLGALVRETRKDIHEWGDATKAGVEIGGKLADAADQIGDAMKRGADGTDEFTRAITDSLPPMDDLDLALNGFEPEKPFNRGTKAANEFTDAIGRQLQVLAEAKGHLRDIRGELDAIIEKEVDAILGGPAVGDAGYMMGTDHKRMAEANRGYQEARQAAAPKGPGTAVSGTDVASALTGVDVAAAAATGGISLLADQLLGAVTATEGYADIMAQVSRLLGVVVAPASERLSMLADILEPVVTLFDALWPIIDAVNVAMNPMLAVLPPIAEAFQMLEPPLRRFEYAIRKLMEWIETVLPGNQGIHTGGSGGSGLHSWMEDVSRESEGELEGGSGTMPEGYDEIDAATGAATGALGDFAEAVQEATGALTNVPRIFRANLRRGQASDGSVDKSHWGDYVGPEGIAGGTFNVYGDVIVPGVTMEEVNKNLARQNYVKHGTTHQGASADFSLKTAG